MLFRDLHKNKDLPANSWYKIKLKVLAWTNNRPEENSASSTHPIMSRYYSPFHSVSEVTVFAAPCNV